MEELKRRSGPLPKSKRQNLALNVLQMPCSLDGVSRLGECLLIRKYLIIEMIWWTGLAPWDFEFPFLCSIVSTFLVLGECPVGCVLRFVPTPG